MASGSRLARAQSALVSSRMSGRLIHSTESVSKSRWSIVSLHGAAIRANSTGTQVPFATDLLGDIS